MQGPAPVGSESQAPSPRASFLRPQAPGHPPADLSAPSEVAIRLGQPIAARDLLPLPLVGYRPHVASTCSFEPMLIIQLIAVPPVWFGPI